MTALVIVDHDNQSLKAATLNAVAAALRCCPEVDLLVMGSDCDRAARAAARISGIGKVRVADALHFKDGLAESLADQIVSVAGAYSHILAAATAHGKNVLPRVAALLDVAQISEVIRVGGPDEFDRPIYAGNAVATVKSGEAIKVMTVRATAFEPVPQGEVEAPIEPLTPNADPRLARFVGRSLSAVDRPELTTAKNVVSGGRGVGSAENYEALLTPLADALNAALGASRAAVDAGYAPNDYQVGQTGKIVAPQLYVAVGISGAIQHLAGMKDSKVIVAINKDAEAPIFGVADYGLVGDLHVMVPELVDALG